MRLFIGIELPDALRREVLNAMSALAARIPGNYTAPDNLHITLAFIGEVEPRALARVRASVAAAARKLAPFYIEAGAPGYFGAPARAILYLGARGDNRLAAAAARVKRALDDASVEYDPKPFRAHITLARGAQISAPLNDITGAGGAHIINHITLFHSTRVNNHLTYLPIERAALTGAAE